MELEAPPRRRDVLGIVLAPAIWLERARGRRRLALLAAYAAVGLIVGVLGWRAVSLNDLPDVGDPPGLDALKAIDVSDDRNAFVVYRQAIAKYRPLAPGEIGLQSTFDWSKADPKIRRWVDDNREALAIWRRATERPDALLIPPDQLTFETRMDEIQNLRDFARLASLAASRREQAGDVAGAWDLYRAMLRSSRHVGRHGCIIQRLVGVAIHSMATGGLVPLADDPRIDAATLRSTLREAVALDRTTDPPSVSGKIEYMSMQKFLDNPVPFLREYNPELFNGDPEHWYRNLPKYREGEWFLLREPERSRRLTRLCFANILAHCDEPASVRPPIAPGDLRLYQESPEDGRPSPEELERWSKTTRLFSVVFPSLSQALRAYDRERSQQAALVLHLSEQLYIREHGRSPKTLGDLVGPDLPALPDGYDPGDAPIGATEVKDGKMTKKK
jgi:hypothetical protein